jgi:hypothetical protein
VAFTIDKLTYADGLAYRYHFRDEEGELLYVADRSGMLLPAPTGLVEFFDPGRNLAARMVPSDVLPWQRPTRYEVLVGDEAEPYAVVHEKLTLVDLLTLRMPRYTIEIGDQMYSGRARRYGARLCELSPAHDEGEEAERSDRGDLDGGEETDAQAGASETAEPAALDSLVAADEEGEADRERHQQEWLAAVERLSTGAGYSVFVEDAEEAAPLRDDLFALASLAILIDVELFS